MDPDVIVKSKKILKILAIGIFLSMTIVPLLLKGQREGYSGGLIILIVLFIAIPLVLFIIARIYQKMSEKRKELDLVTDHMGNMSFLSGGIGKAIVIGLGIIAVFFIVAFFIPMPYKVIALLVIAYLMFTVLWSVL